MTSLFVDKPKRDGSYLYFVSSLVRLDHIIEFRGLIIPREGNYFFKDGFDFPIGDFHMVTDLRMIGYCNLCFTLYFFKWFSNCLAMKCDTLAYD